MRQEFIKIAQDSKKRLISLVITLVLGVVSLYYWLMPFLRPEVAPLFMKDQIIVTGRANEIQSVMELVEDAFKTDPSSGELFYEQNSFWENVCPKDPTQNGGPAVTEEGNDGNTSTIDLEKLQPELDLGYVEGLLGECGHLPEYMKPDDKSGLTDPGRWVMRLYEIELEKEPSLWERLFVKWKQGAPAARTVTLINRLADNCSLSVYADIARGTTGLFGEIPWMGKGHPWTGMGSPWTGGFSPYPGDQIEAQEAFRTQWAFLGNYGIGLMRQEGSNDTGTITYTRSITYTGSGVRIGVFDTSPFHGTSELRVEWPIPVSVVIEENPFKMLWKKLRPSSLDGHGQFVARLAHEVAPASEIYLYRVLNADGVNNLFALNTALHTFISETVAVRNTLNGAVINLSLGSPALLHRKLLKDVIVNVLGEEENAEEFIDKYLNDQAMSDTISDIARKISISREGPGSLNALLAAARCHGMVVVAAAGNTGENKYMVQIPASLPGTLSVASSNYEGELACFSHSGKDVDVLAPGGNGVEGLSSKCKKPPLDGCSVNSPDNGDCRKYGVIGLVGESDEYPTGYVYGVGTSFSTPLVSGLAALVLEAKGGWQSQEHPEWQTPDGGLADYVFKRIRDAAGCTGGVINVPKALAGASCPTPTPAPTPTPTSTS